MDVLLIDPPYCSLKGIPTDVGYNIGLTSLAAYLRREGFDTAVVMGDLLMDLPFTSAWGWFSFNLSKYAQGQLQYSAIVNDKNHPVWQKISSIVREQKPKAVGISYLTPFRDAVERVAAIVKETDSNIKVIAGAAHPTLCPQEVMLNPNIDFVVCGEGEIPLSGIASQLIKDKPEWSSVPGIYYRDQSGQIMSTPLPPPIPNLDELPFAARDAVLGCDYERYRVHCLTTSRGCPYTCAFCSDRRLWGGKVRRRSVENVIAELKYLEQNYKVDVVDFSDGTFTYDRKYVEAFCKAVIENNISLKWRCTARYDNLDVNLLKLMKNANCGGLYLGAESGSDRILGAMDKKITAEQIKSISKMVHDVGLDTVTAIIIGFPDETREDIEATLDLMKHLQTDIFDVSSFIPLPGTPAWEIVPEEDKKNIDWKKVSYKSLDNYFLKNVSAEDFRRYMTQAYKIAGRVQRRTVIRFGLRMLQESVRGWFKKSQSMAENRGTGKSTSNIN
ncbi:MAG TPA: radical SAM protein [Syntrophomonas sp.]|nr:radical SAM protein [Syntrophomonas sp.]